MGLAGSERGRSKGHSELRRGHDNGGLGRRAEMGSGDSAFGAAELEGPRTGKWRLPDTVVRRGGEQARLKYSFSVDELLEGMSDS